MDWLNIILIGIGLSMDAFAVSITCGLSLKEIRLKHPLKVGLFFGGFQAIMPILGWLAGFGLREFIASFDHWIAFVLLAFIGGKMVWESRKKECDEAKADPFQTLTLLGLAVATSIDALAVGLSFAFLGVTVFLPALVIGCITFAISFAGVWLGKKSGVSGRNGWN